MTDALTAAPGSPFPNVSGSAPVVNYSPLVNPSTLFAAVSNTNNTVNVYRVNTSTGAFTPVTGSPFSTLPGTGSFQATFSPLIGTSTLYAATANGTSNNSTVYRVELLNVIISPSIQVVCLGDIIQFSATVTNGQAPYNYVWTDPNGFSQSTGTTPTLTIPNSTLLNAGNYFVTVTDALGCVGNSPLSTVIVKSLIC